MLGFSLPKIILLVVIILIVWYGFKIIEKRSSMHKKKPSNIDENKNNRKFKADNVQDLEKCPNCKNYFLSGSK